MEIVVFSLFNGALYGMLLFLLSSGFTLIFGLMGILNIAHASFYMLGAYLAYQISITFGFWMALFTAPLVIAAVGMVLERTVLRHVRSEGHTAELLVTFGLSFVIAEIVQMIWGRSPAPYQVPASLNFPLFTFGGLDYSAYKVFSLAVTVLVFIGLYGGFRRTTVGLVIQAALTHPVMVAALGHNVPKIFTSVFGLGAGLAALGGVLAGNVLGTQPTMAIHLGTIMFVVVVVGGLGSFVGALIASLMIGIVQTFAVSFPLSVVGALESIGLNAAALGPDLENLTTQQIAPAIPYVIMIVILLLRPRGLFGARGV
jgi:branched-chain amino acid transport system permease protein